MRVHKCFLPGLPFRLVSRDGISYYGSKNRVKFDSHNIHTLNIGKLTF